MQDYLFLFISDKNQEELKTKIITTETIHRALFVPSP